MADHGKVPSAPEVEPPEGTDSKILVAFQAAIAAAGAGITVTAESISDAIQSCKTLVNSSSENFNSQTASNRLVHLYGQYNETESDNSGHAEAVYEVLEQGITQIVRADVSKAWGNATTVPQVTRTANEFNGLVNVVKEMSIPGGKLELTANQASNIEKMAPVLDTFIENGAAGQLKTRALHYIGTLQQINLHDDGMSGQLDQILKEYSKIGEITNPTLLAKINDKDFVQTWGESLNFAKQKIAEFEEEKKKAKKIMNGPIVPTILGLGDDNLVEISEDKSSGLVVSDPVLDRSDADGNTGVLLKDTKGNVDDSFDSPDDVLLYLDKMSKSGDAIQKGFYGTLLTIFAKTIYETNLASPTQLAYEKTTNPTDYQTKSENTVWYNSGYQHRKDPKTPWTKERVRKSAKCFYAAFEETFSSLRLADSTPEEQNDIRLRAAVGIGSLNHIYCPPSPGSANFCVNQDLSDTKAQVVYLAAGFQSIASDGVVFSKAKTAMMSLKSSDTSVVPNSVYQAAYAHQMAMPGLSKTVFGPNGIPIEKPKILITESVSAADQPTFGAGVYKSLPTFAKNFLGRPTVSNFLESVTSYVRPDPVSPFWWDGQVMGFPEPWKYFLMQDMPVDLLIAGYRETACIERNTKGVLPLCQNYAETNLNKYAQPLLGGQRSLQKQDAQNVLKHLKVLEEGGNPVVLTSFVYQTMSEFMMYGEIRDKTTQETFNAAVGILEDSTIEGTLDQFNLVSLFRTTKYAYYKTFLEKYTGFVSPLIPVRSPSLAIQELVDVHSRYTSTTWNPWPGRPSLLSPVSRTLPLVVKDAKAYTYGVVGRALMTKAEFQVSTTSTIKKTDLVKTIEPIFRREVATQSSIGYTTIASTFSDLKDGDDGGSNAVELLLKLDSDTLEETISETPSLDFVSPFVSINGVISSADIANAIAEKTPKIKDVTGAEAEVPGALKSDVGNDTLMLWLAYLGIAVSNFVANKVYFSMLPNYPTLAEGGRRVCKSIRPVAFGGLTLYSLGAITFSDTAPRQPGLDTLEHHFGVLTSGEKPWDERSLGGVCILDGALVVWKILGAIFGVSDENADFNSIFLHIAQVFGVATAFTITGGVSEVFKLDIMPGQARIDFLWNVVLFYCAQCLVASAFRPIMHTHVRIQNSGNAGAGITEFVINPEMFNVGAILRNFGVDSAASLVPLLALGSYGLGFATKLLPYYDSVPPLQGSKLAATAIFVLVSGLWVQKSIAEQESQVKGLQTLTGLFESAGSSTNFTNVSVARLVGATLRPTGQTGSLNPRAIALLESLTTSDEVLIMYRTNANRKQVDEKWKALDTPNASDKGPQLVFKITLVENKPLDVKVMVRSLTTVRSQPWFQQAIGVLNRENITLAKSITDALRTETNNNIKAVHQLAGALKLVQAPTITPASANVYSVDKQVPVTNTTETRGADKSVTKNSTTNIVSLTQDVLQMIPGSIKPGKSWSATDFSVPIPGGLWGAAGSLAATIGYPAVLFAYQYFGKKNSQAISEDLFNALFNWAQGPMIHMLLYYFTTLVDVQSFIGNSLQGLKLSTPKVKAALAAPPARLPPSGAENSRLLKYLTEYGIGRVGNYGDMLDSLYFNRASVITTNGESELKEAGYASLAEIKGRLALKIATDGFYVQPAGRRTFTITDLAANEKTVDMTRISQTIRPGAIVFMIGAKDELTDDFTNVLKSSLGIPF